ncbi:MAG: cellulase family glycosylhydrolase [Treponema sp.]|nr:cellulase family glycosylhydrolase [Treponema sp.]
MFIRKRQLAITVLAAITGFLMTGCPGGDSGNDTGHWPASPEPMSGKTAMEYFRDEGIAVGINLANTLDAVNYWDDPGNPTAIETVWGAPKANQALFNGYKNQGFDIVRIPVSWLGHIGPAPEYKIEETYLKRVAEVAGYAKNAGLKAFINMHHDGSSPEGEDYGWLSIKKAVGSKSGYDQITDKFGKVWTQIAGYFINYGDWLMFEGMNEICNVDYNTSHWWGYIPDGDQPEYEIINAWNQKFSDSVRATGGNNFSRYLIFPGYCADWDKTAGAYFKLPSDNTSGRQVVTFHFYHPGDFAYLSETHEWPNSSWDGSKAYIDEAFGAMKTYFTSKNIPVVIGENAPARYIKNDANTETARQNRLAYIDYMYGKARENEIVPCYLETPFIPEEPYADFSLFNRITGQPNSQESAEVIQHMISAAKGAVSPPPWVDPASQTTPLTGGMVLNGYSGGNVNLPGSPYGYETWDESEGAVASANTFTWYGANQGGGGAYKAGWAGYLLARLGFFWGVGGKYTQYKNIYADYNYNRSDNASTGGGFIGVYGWSRNPSASEDIKKLIEYYIVDDWFYDVQLDLEQIGSFYDGIKYGEELGSFEVDGAAYKIYANPRINEPSIDGTLSFIQIFSVRQGRRSCGTISVTEHFKAWSKYIELGNMFEAKFIVEAFGGGGWLDLTYLYLSQEESRRNIPEGTTPVDSGGIGEVTVAGPYTDYASNPYVSLFSPSAYSIVNLTGENKTNVMKVANPADWAVAIYDLSAYEGQNVTVSFSANVMRAGSAGNLGWQINNPGDYPAVGASVDNAEPGVWYPMGGEWTGVLTAEIPALYLNTFENNSESATFYIDGFTAAVK